MGADHMVVWAKVGDGAPEPQNRLDNWLVTITKSLVKVVITRLGASGSPATVCTQRWAVGSAVKAGVKSTFKGRRLAAFFLPERGTVRRFKPPCAARLRHGTAAARWPEPAPRSASSASARDRL